MNDVRVNDLTVLLNVRDMAASLVFYRILGFDIAARYPTDGEVRWARLVAGATTLMLNASPAVARRPRRRNAAAYDDVVLHVGVADVKVAHAKLVAAGKAPEPITAEMYGVFEFTVRDPDGYEVALTSPREMP